MDLLVLGGTAFLGRAIAAAALTAGHEVTCAARGSAPVAEGARLVRVDRDDEAGLEPLRHHRWDAVVDVARKPGHVRRAVRDLDAGHWVFVSTGNVYARFDRPEQDEDSALVDPLDGEAVPDMSLYGPAKVACEEAVRAASASATLVRAGLIAGPGDTSGRSGYYPWRFAHPTGADVLVPPDLEQPVAMIDVDDLARWLVTAAEQSLDLTANATGPTTTLGEVLEAARAVAGRTARVRPVPAPVLARAGVAAWMGTPSLPLWLDDPAWRFFATMDTSRARAHGLTTRPLAQTLTRALSVEQTRSEPRQAGLSDDEERALRRALDEAHR